MVLFPGQHIVTHIVIDVSITVYMVYELDFVPSLKLFHLSQG